MHMTENEMDALRKLINDQQQSMLLLQEVFCRLRGRAEEMAVMEHRDELATPLLEKTIQVLRNVEEAMADLDEAMSEAGKLHESYMRVLEEIENIRL